MRLKLSLPVMLLTFAGILALVACGPSSGAGDSAAQPEAAENATAACGAQYVPSTEAGDHLGKEVTVCGRVADYIYVTGETGNPTLLLYDKGAIIERGSSISDQKLPQTFEVVVWKKDAKNFPANFGATYSGNTVCATGVVETHNDNPAIFVSAPDQLQVDC